jgi:hypothetical protein
MGQDLTFQQEIKDTVLQGLCRHRHRSITRHRPTVPSDN